MQLRNLPILILVLIVGVVLQTEATAAQVRVESITLTDALALFAANNLELELARTTAAEAVGFARQARSYPNPVAAVEHESLSDASGGSETETIFAVSQQLDWPWRYSHRRRAGGRAADAALEQLAADSIRLAFETKQAFMEADLAERALRAVEQVAAVFRRAEESGAARLSEGDISGYELRRIRVERAGYEVQLRHAQMDVARKRRHLTALLLPDSSGVLLSPAGPTRSRPPSVDRDEILANAFAQRPEVAAARLSIEAAAAARSYSRSGFLPDWNLIAGYKSTSFGFDGPVLGLEVPVPLFDRRGGESDAAQARLAAAEHRDALVRRQVENDVTLALDNYTSLQQRARLISDTLLTGTDDLLEIAQASYAEGEMSLLELMDAAVAFRDAQDTKAHVTVEIWIAYYDLERAIGGFAAPDSTEQGNSR